MNDAAYRLRRVVGARVLDRVSSDRRRHNRKNYITNRYYKDPVERRQFGPVVPKSLTWHKDNRPPPRAQYFKTFRSERTALKMMENAYLRDPKSRREYRNCRYCYYAVLPHLERLLWFEPDRERIRQVEVDYYYMLLAFSSARKRSRAPDRWHVRWNRDPVPS